MDQEKLFEVITRIMTTRGREQCDLRDPGLALRRAIFESRKRLLFVSYTNHLINHTRNLLQDCLGKT